MSSWSQWLKHFLCVNEWGIMGQSKRRNMRYCEDDDDDDDNNDQDDDDKNNDGHCCGF